MADTTYALVSDFTTRYLGGRNADAPSVQAMINAAAVMVDGLTRGYRPGYEAFSASASEQRLFNDDIQVSGIVEIDDALTVTALTRGSSTVGSTYYQLYPYNPGNGPYTRILMRMDLIWLLGAVISPSSWYGYPYPGVGAAQVAVTGTWGYCTAANRPAVVKEATLALAKQLFDEGAYTAKDMLQAVQNPTAWVDKRVYALLQRAGLIRGESDGRGMFA